MSGIIAASGQASSGLFSGIAPGAKIYNIKVLNNTGSGFEDDIIAGIEWSVNNSMDIINLSLGGGSPDPYDPESMALKNATARGVVCVVSAGNSGPNYFSINSPAAAPGAIAVGAINNHDNIAGFSSCGPSLNGVFQPSIVAPGVSIVSVLAQESFIERYVTYYGASISGSAGSDNAYVSLSGTSMAAPIVAGSIALILQKYKSYVLAPEIISAGLMETARDLNMEPCLQGMGLLNVTNAIEYLEALRAANNFTSILRAFPKKVPYAPFEIFFPGEEIEVAIKTLFVSMPSFHLDLSGAPEGIEISSGASIYHPTSASGEEIIKLHVKTSFDLAPGTYNFSIWLKDSLNNTRDTLAVYLDIRDARYRILMDSFDAIQDIYTGPDRQGRIAMDYHGLRKELAQASIQLVIEMDYWTSGYNSTHETSKLTYEDLELFDTVILLPVKTGLFNDELDAIKKYRDRGGNLMILGTRYQGFARSNVNSLLGVLNTNVTFNVQNLENIVDLGWESSIDTIRINALNESHFINECVDHITWSTGTKLGMNGTGGEVLVSDGLGTPLVSLVPRDAGKGAILIAGSEEIVPVNINMNDSANTRFFMNVIDYFMNDSGLHVNMHGLDQAGVQDQVPMFFQVVNRTSSVACNYSALSINSCDVYNGTGFVTSIPVVNNSGTWFGNDAFQAGTLAPGPNPYEVVLNVTVGMEPYVARGAFVRYVGSRVMIAINVSSDSIYRDSYITLENSSQVVNQDMIVSGYGNSIFSNKESYFL
nr:S8 family serine peptidase [Candidatus Sigynarchaeota archaeon]